MKIINFKKRSMKLLAKEHQESYENAKICYICKEKFENKYSENKEHCKVTNHVVDKNSLLSLLFFVHLYYILFNFPTITFITPRADESNI